MQTMLRYSATEQVDAIEELERRQAIEALDLDVRSQSREQRETVHADGRRLHKSGHEWWRSHEPTRPMSVASEPQHWMAWRVQGTLLYDAIDCAHRLQRIWAELTDWQAAQLAGDVALLCQAVDRAEAQVERSRTALLQRAIAAGSLAEVDRKERQSELRQALRAIVHPPLSLPAAGRFLVGDSPLRHQEAPVAT